MKTLLLTFLSLALPASGLKKILDLDYVGNGNPRQKLDLYLPKKTADPLPLVIWIHGGAWRHGSKTNPQQALQAAHLGLCAVASINYRLRGRLKKTKC